MSPETAAGQFVSVQSGKSLHCMGMSSKDTTSRKFLVGQVYFFCEHSHNIQYQAAVVAEGGRRILEIQRQLLTAEAEVISSHVL